MDLRYGIWIHPVHQHLVTRSRHPPSPGVCGGALLVRGAVVRNAVHGQWPMTCCGSHDTGEGIPGSMDLWMLHLGVSVSHDLGWIHGSHPMVYSSIHHVP